MVRLIYFLNYKDDQRPFRSPEQFTIAMIALINPALWYQIQISRQFIRVDLVLIQNFLQIFLF